MEETRTPTLVTAKGDGDIMLADMDEKTRRSLAKLDKDGSGGLSPKEIAISVDRAAVVKRFVIAVLSAAALLVVSFVAMGGIFYWVIVRCMRGAVTELMASGARGAFVCTAAGICARRP